GYTTSNDGDVSGSRGSQDYWVINVSQNGKLNWQKVLGGTEADYANSVLTDKDGGYIVGGISYSSDGDITAAKGDGDYWVVKLDAGGQLVWKNNWGGSQNDNLHYMIYSSAADEYYLAGDSESGDGDFSSSKGETDFGIIKLKTPALTTKDSAVCNIGSFIPFTDTLKDACGYDSVVVAYNPVALKGPFDSLRKADTIFAGESIQLHAGGNGTVTWNTHSTLSCSNCTDPVATPVTTTVYTATTTLEGGCSISDDFTVVVLKDAMVMTPSAFTPNGDGLNDFFGPIGKVPDGYTMHIYNRYGQLVFRSNSIDYKWNGRFNGKPEPSGVFVYLITYKDLQNQPKQQKGTLVLIR
ncbi:MAG: gliding motility-associated C-terminal domain-containing protein, partial [Bacteroidetes bacterium]|nr:gliding motility-associated C-terminal domain-containing protein [Bacteroidota bacterium]